MRLLFTFPIVSRFLFHLVFAQDDIATQPTTTQQPSVEQVAIDSGLFLLSPALNAWNLEMEVIRQHQKLGRR